MTRDDVMRLERKIALDFKLKSEILRIAQLDEYEKLN